MAHSASHGHTLREMTLRGIVLGALITVVFTAANVYLGLKVGLTFASSIPAAVISMAVLKAFKGANILENNMVQTQASAAGTLSAVIFVLPGLLMIGYWGGVPFLQTALICAIGGVLGVLYTIPLRRVMVVQSSLPYPEGVAAAEILRVGESAQQQAAAGQKNVDTGAKDILFGGVIAALFSLASSGFKVLSESVSVWFAVGRAPFQLATGFSLALVGAGYLVGIVGGLAILTGTLIAWGVAVPWLTALTPESTGQSLQAIATEQWASQVRFIGAGTIAVAAVWTLATLFKPMVEGMRASFKAMGAAAGGEGPARTDRDLSSKGILAILGVLLLALLAVFGYFLLPSYSALGATAFYVLLLSCTLFVFVFGFLIAAACGYMAGLVGSSSSPISGIAIIAVVLVSLMILGFSSLGGLLDGLGAEQARQLPTALALFATSVILAVAAISNDNLQDLKTGYLVGATPRSQQLVLMIGCGVGALIIPLVLSLLYNAYGFTGALPRPDMDPSQALGAPQATLMAAIVQGVFNHDLNWTMLGIGAAIGAGLIVVDELLRLRGGAARLPVLAVGIGIYLPPSVNMPLVIGAVLAWLIDRRLVRRAAATGRSFDAVAEAPRRRAVLLASGLIVGESLLGVTLAGIIGVSGERAPLALASGGGSLPQMLGTTGFVVVCLWLYRRVLTAR